MLFRSKVMSNIDIVRAHYATSAQGNIGEMMAHVSPQVRMVTHAAPHQGLGVDQYAWSTSPLRRYTDLVNQWQILSCIEHGVAAPLAATFKPRDADLFAIVSGFDAAYAAYADFQNNMERYWCLRWLGQQNARQVEAVVLKDEVLRLVEIPLIVRLPGMQPLARGTQVKLDLLRWNEVDLSVEARLLEVMSGAAVQEADLEDALEDAPEDATEDATEGAIEETAVGAVDGVADGEILPGAAEPESAPVPVQEASADLPAGAD